MMLRDDYRKWSSDITKRHDLEGRKGGTGKKKKTGREAIPPAIRHAIERGADRHAVPDETARE